jgi:uncharacterized protein (TIGR02231 family)
MCHNRDMLRLHGFALDAAKYVGARQFSIRVCAGREYKMRRRFFVAMTFAIVQASTAAFAADVDVTSTIDSVTVFPRGAEVIRKATVKLGKGSHQLVLRDLPAGTVPGSIRIEGTASAGLDIGAVDQRRVHVQSNGGSEHDRKRKEIEERIEQLEDQIKAHEATIESRLVQKRFIENLAALPTRPAPASTAAETRTGADWTMLFDLIGSRLADVQAEILRTQVSIRDLKRTIEDLQKKLAGLAPETRMQTEVRFGVVAAQELQTDLNIIYQVPGAGWRPLYDARLETGSRNVPAKLVLVRRAAITQQTGEPWHGVSVSLSTTRPAASSGAPTLDPLIVAYEAPPPVVRKQSVGERDDGRTAVRRRMAPQAQGTHAAPAPAAPMLEVQERTAAVHDAGFHAIFEITDRISVSNTGDATRVSIESTELEPALGIRTVPKRDRQAFLYAKFELPRTVPYLPGRVSLFRDRAFVGFGQLPQLAPGESHEIGFGPDDLVRVKYEVTRQTQGETGLISASRTDQRQYKITIRNLHERPVSYMIVDQLPVPADDSIKVDLRGGTPPSQRNVEDRRGIVAWTGKLGADEEKTIDFGYVVSWPADKQVQYR